LAPIAQLRVKSAAIAYGRSKISPFYSAMNAGQLASTDTGLDRSPVRLRARKTTGTGRDGRGATSLPVAVVLALFVTLVATAVLVGRVMIAPELFTKAGSRGGARVAAIVYSMPDGSFCRRLSFDNETATLSEGAVEPCPANLPRVRLRGDRNFAWGAR
jgi:hypothetical protein